MRKEDMGYRLEESGSVIEVTKDGKCKAKTVGGVVSALEAIFVLEGMTKKDWLVYEDGIVWLVDRVEVGKGKFDETP